MKSAHEFRFLNHLIIFCIIGHDSDAVDRPLTSQLCAGNILGTLQIYNVTVILEIVEFTLPVRAQNKTVHIIFNNIADLLPLVLFYDDLICKTCFPHVFNSFQQTVFDIQLTPLNVIAFTGDSYDQIISQFSGSLQDIIMPLMKQIESAISNDFFHYLSCSFCYSFSVSVSPSSCGSIISKISSSSCSSSNSCGAPASASSVSTSKSSST